MASTNNYILPPGIRTKKTLKIVILGDSGVGKTCLMNQFSTGTFTGQYKATIGADFITKDVVVVDTMTGQNHIVTLQIWDTAGQERFQSLGVGFYRGADAAILTYDITDPTSLDHLNHWKDEFLENVGSTMIVGGTGSVGYSSLSSTPQFPFVVIGNKYDKDKKGRKIPFHRAEEWCRTHGSSSSTSIPSSSTMNPVPTMSGQYYDQNNNNYYQNNNPYNTATINMTMPLPHYETSAKTGYNVTEAFQEVARLAMQYEEYRRRSQPQLFIPPPPSQQQQQQNVIDLQRQYSSFDYNNNNNNKSCC